MKVGDGFPFLKGSEGSRKNNGREGIDEAAAKKKRFEQRVHEKAGMICSNEKRKTCKGGANKKKTHAALDGCERKETQKDRRRGIGRITSQTKK